MSIIVRYKVLTLIVYIINDKKQLLEAIKSN